MERQTVYLNAVVVSLQVHKLEKVQEKLWLKFSIESSTNLPWANFKKLKSMNHFDNQY